MKVASKLALEKWYRFRSWRGFACSPCTHTQDRKPCIHTRMTATVNVHRIAALAAEPNFGVDGVCWQRLGLSTVHTMLCLRGAGRLMLSALSDRHIADDLDWAQLARASVQRCLALLVLYVYCNGVYLDQGDKQRVC